MNFRGGKRTKKKRSKSHRKACGPACGRKTKSTNKEGRPPVFTASLLERLSKHKYLSMRDSMRTSMRTSMRSRNKTKGRKS